MGESPAGRQGEVPRESRTSGAERSTGGPPQDARSAAQGEAAAAAEGTGRWASSDGLAVEYGGAAVLSDWQQRTLEAAYRRGDATLQYPFRGDMHTFTLRPPEQRRVVDGQGKAADLRRNQ